MKTETEGFVGMVLATALLIATRQAFGFESAALLGLLFIMGLLVGIYNEIGKVDSRPESEQTRQ